eukprot:scaffold119185_cov70-Phaeocystis_antarctica.AAC.2
MSRVSANFHKIVWFSLVRLEHAGATALLLSRDGAPHFEPDRPTYPPDRIIQRCIIQRNIKHPRLHCKGCSESDHYTAPSSQQAASAQLLFWERLLQ